MSNKDLLKQAIAEAKTIREAAIANAKEALEETLTPHLKEMLAQKLQEMEDKEDEEVMDENIYEAEEEVETPEEDEAPKGEEEEELEIEDMSVEDLKDLIRDIVAQETGHDEEAEMETGEESQDDMTNMDDSEEIDINELLAELEGMDEKKNYMDETDGYGKVKKIPGKPTHSYSLKPGAESGDTKGPNDGYVKESEEMDEYGSAATDMGTSHKNTGRELDTQLVNFLKTATPEVISKVKAFLKGLPAGAGAAMRAEGSQQPKMEARNTKGMEEDLNEALKAVKILRNQLQEVNLLNAKLLYVNKVFKSNNLSEGQKVNVIAAFDKAETVKEVKLVFETVSKNVVAKPATIKEHRSFASKATGNAQTTAPKEILSEVSEQVARWQKLAGIIKS